MQRRSFNSLEQSDQHNDLDDSNDEVEEDQNETNENEIEESDDSEARHRRRRKIRNEVCEANTVDEDDVVLNYNPPSDNEAEETWNFSYNNLFQDTIDFNTNIDFSKHSFKNKIIINLSKIVRKSKILFTNINLNKNLFQNKQISFLKCSKCYHI